MLGQFSCRHFTPAAKIAIDRLTGRMLIATAAPKVGVRFRRLVLTGRMSGVALLPYGWQVSSLPRHLAFREEVAQRGRKRAQVAVMIAVNLLSAAISDLTMIWDGSILSGEAVSSHSAT